MLQNGIKIRPITARQAKQLFSHSAGAGANKRKAIDLNENAQLCKVQKTIDLDVQLSGSSSVQPTRSSDDIQMQLDSIDLSLKDSNNEVDTDELLIPLDEEIQPQTISPTCWLGVDVQNNKFSNLQNNSSICHKDIVNFKLPTPPPKLMAYTCDERDLLLLINRSDVHLKGKNRSVDWDKFKSKYEYLSRRACIENPSLRIYQRDWRKVREAAAKIIARSKC